MVLLIISMPICLAESVNPVLDANGNLVSGDGFYREYNELNQLVRVYEGDDNTGNLLHEYIWHPTEERILVKDVYSSGAWKETIYYVDENYVVKENASGEYKEVYIKIDGQLVAQETNGEKQSLHPDHLGSTSLILDSTGSIVENTWYSPFGEVVAGGEDSRFDYTGMEKDEETEEYDYHARMYDSDNGRFNQPDSQIQNVFVPQGLNRYGYVLNNPYKFIDPSGRNYRGLYDSDAVGGAGHSAGIVFNKDYAAYYSQEANSDASKLEMGVKRTVDGSGVYLEANSIEELYDKYGDILSRYDKSFDIETEKTQDDLMKKKMEELYNIGSYNLYGDNCAQRQSSILDAGGVANFRDSVPIIHYYGTQLVQSINRASNYAKSILRSIASTLRSGKKITWYSRKDEESGETRYTYRVGDSKPSNSDYKEIEKEDD